MRQGKGQLGVRMRLKVGVALATVFIALSASGTAAQAAELDKPRAPAAGWMTPEFRALVDAAGTRGVPVDEHSVLDVCPGVVAFHEGGVGTGTCLVYPYGCTANFIYYPGTGSAPAVADGKHYLGTAGHCSDKVGESVYGAISTPGVGTSIAKIGTVAQRIDDYDGSRVYDFEAIRIEPGFQIYPESPVGGPTGIYDGCAAGTPLKYYGHGYVAAVAQGKPEGGVSSHWYDDGYGWFGVGAMGDSGSGVLTADGLAAGNFTAIILVDPSLSYLTGELVGSRMTWILSYLGGGYSLVNADYSLSNDTTTSCGTTTDGGGGGGGGGQGGGKGGGGKGGGKNGTKA